MSGRRHDAESTEIRIVQTDADRGKWPPIHEERIPSGDPGDRLLVRASEKTSKEWRTKIANYLRSKDHPGQINNEAILKNFPDGYVLLSQYREDNSSRKDTYLFGSIHVRAFRSAAEFFLHADWLRAGMPLNEKGKPDCMCTYCSGVPQKNISNDYDIRKPQNKPSSSRATRGNANREVQKREYHNIGGAAFRN